MRVVKIIDCESGMPFRLQEEIEQSLHLNPQWPSRRFRRKADDVFPLTAKGTKMLRFQAFAIVLIVIIVVAAGKADAQHNVTGISSGDLVTVTRAETRLMLGDETLARLPRGQTFEVRRVRPLVERILVRRPASSAVGQRRPTPPEVRLRPGSRRW